MGPVFTVPNLLSFLRLLAIPVFLWCLLTHRDGWALGIVMFGGLTDFFDGKLALWLDQRSRLGELLDPAADRLYILATVVGLSLREIIPWWLVLALLARDGVLSVGLLLLRRAGYGPLPVHFLGKAATMNLLYAFPLLLLGQGSSTWSDAAWVAGWAFALWGVLMYWWAALVYLSQVRALLRQPATSPPAQPTSAFGSGEKSEQESGPVGAAPAPPLA